MSIFFEFEFGLLSFCELIVLSVEHCGILKVSVQRNLVLQELEFIVKCLLVFSVELKCGINYDITS